MKTQLSKPSLSESAQRFEAVILCFVLMGNHFHLVAQTHRANLRRWMHWLLVCCTVYFNGRHRSSGHLFQKKIRVRAYYRHKKN